MKKKVLIVEDQFVEAHDLQLMLAKAGYEVCGIARSVPIALNMIEKEQPELVLVDIFLKGQQTGIDLARYLKDNNIAFIYLSANSNEEILAAAKTTEPYGFIVKPYREKDLLITLEIAQYRHEHSRETRVRREASLMRQLQILVSADITRKEKLLQAAKLLQQEIPFDYLAVGFDIHGMAAGSAVSFLRIAFNDYQVIGLKELSTISGIARDELIRVISASGPLPGDSYYNGEAFDQIAQQLPVKKLVRKFFHLDSLLSYRSFCFYSRRSDTYNTEHISLLDRFEDALISLTEQKPADANAGNGTSVVDKTQAGFEGIIGNSHLLLNVFDLVTQVAPFDTSVLLLGESGTGKERIAECLHQLSPRKAVPLVKVNCAALPATLIESELFGHEKGSFTGAIGKRIGKFDQANGGTIFLDEIGEMSVDLQVKLLRVLQEKEIEPIGGRSPVKIDVRVIAATNRNLEKEVAEGRFRLDLYYRLNVFPIVLPPLRERMEDLPLLAMYYVGIFNRKSGKSVTGFSDRAMKNMMGYHWPGNIRELEHLVERSVLLARGTEIEDIMLPVQAAGAKVSAAPDLSTKTIYENERDHIIVVLKKCNGRIWGKGGAAEMLNVPPSTLKSKMKKLGIAKEGY